MKNTDQPIRFCTFGHMPVAANVKLKLQLSGDQTHTAFVLLYLVLFERHHSEQLFENMWILLKSKFETERCAALLCVPW